MFHKPKGVVVTSSDERGRKTVYHLLPAWIREEGWVPAGRLDMDTRGLIFLVREGGLVDFLTRPGTLDKTYEVFVRGRVGEEQVASVKAGVPTPIGPLKASRVEIAGRVGPKTRLFVTLREGKNRHIRRMFGALRDAEKGTPLKVMDLKRTAIGPVSLDVPSGSWRFLNPDEERKLLGRQSTRNARGGHPRFFRPPGAVRGEKNGAESIESRK